MNGVIGLIESVFDPRLLRSGGRGTHHCVFVCVCADKRPLYAKCSSWDVYYNLDTPILVELQRVLLEQLLVTQPVGAVLIQGSKLTSTFASEIVGVSWAT